MINFPLSVWSPTSFQIVSHLRPSPVENCYYHSGSLKPNMLVKRENVLKGGRRRPLLTDRMWFDQSTLCRSGRKNPRPGGREEAGFEPTVPCETGYISRPFS